MLIHLSTLLSTSRPGLKGILAWCLAPNTQGGPNSIN